ncbi:Os11g0487600 [Oryza sativa Japonica Group]|nr:Os11g0487600 [Oryza sativa Japonica Group]|eukprot:NP_001067918.2 Os11g0487600 [Oryza sativa Japonica Group]
MAVVALPPLLAKRHGHARRVNGGGAAIPGPRGWPLLGSLPVVSGPLMHRRLAALADAHGGGARRLMSLTLGATPVVVSSHPDTVREILAGAAFRDRPARAAARELMFLRAVGFAPASGDDGGAYWRRLRRAAGAGMLSPRRAAALAALRARVARRTSEAVSRGMAVPPGRVAMRALLHAASLDNMVGSVLGLEHHDHHGGVISDMGDMVREGYELVGKFNLGDYYSTTQYQCLWGLLDFHGVGPRCQRLAARVREQFGRVMEERRKVSDLHKRDDLLSYMLSMPQEERIEDSDVIAVLWEMIFRGTDVVAILLEWAMARMVLHPDIQSKVQEELDRAVGHRPMTDSDIPNLRFLHCVIKETLRMHPPGPLLSWARLAVHDTYVGKHLVPAGTTAMVNMWAISHDETIWGDPWVFRPERFMEEDINVLGSDLRLAPFGSGRRVCPGRMMGLSTAYLWFGRMLQEYKWAAAQPVKLTECLRLSMEMKKPLVCHAVPRSKTG